MSLRLSLPLVLIGRVKQPKGVSQVFLKCGRLGTLSIYQSEGSVRRSRVWVHDRSKPNDEFACPLAIGGDTAEGLSHFFEVQAVERATIATRPVRS
jgi:hypothetical protein